MHLPDGLVLSPEYLAFAGMLVGLCVGSFLNVVAWRLPQMMEREDRAACREILSLPAEPPAPAFNLNTPGSHCPACKTPIKPWHNVPVLGWLLLRGHCAACQAPISPRYPLVEAATGLLTAYTAWHFGATPAMPAALVMTWALVALTLIDYDTQLLPDAITLPLVWSGLLLSVGNVFVDMRASILGAAVAYCGLRGFSEFYGWVRNKVAMGHGDFKLFAAFGAWFGLKALLPILVLSAVSASIVGIPLQVLSRMRGKAGDLYIPYGPFLAMAGWLMLVFGDPILGAWLRFAAPQ